MPYKDPVRQRAAQARLIEIKRRRKQEVLYAIKAREGCYFCPEREPIALAFHHLDPAQKKFSIMGPKLANGTPIETLLEEVTKCVVLCHNCHAKLHAGLLALPANISGISSAR